MLNSNDQEFTLGDLLEIRKESVMTKPMDLNLSLGTDRDGFEVDWGTWIERNWHQNI